jgi:Flp pilus assembly CpaE family ATPase
MKLDKNLIPAAPTASKNDDFKNVAAKTNQRIDAAKKKTNIVMSYLSEVKETMNPEVYGKHLDLVEAMSSLGPVSNWAEKRQAQALVNEFFALADEATVAKTAARLQKSKGLATRVARMIAGNSDPAYDGIRTMVDGILGADPGTMSTKDAQNVSRALNDLYAVANVWLPKN